MHHLRDFRVLGPGSWVRLLNERKWTAGDVTALSFHKYGVASSGEQKIGSAVQCSGDEDGQKSAPRAGMDLRIMISWPLVLQTVLAALVQQYSRRLRSQIQSSVFTPAGESGLHLY
jgi:hypothetical protein